MATLQKEGSDRGRGGTGRSAGDGSSCGSSISIDDAISADLLHNILSRLPASSFASAACVNRSWNTICSRIISSPKLSSALSLNLSLSEAVNEVFEKVLSTPIRPQFAIVYVGPNFYPEAHTLITKRLGAGIPVITCSTDGIIGRDALTDEFKEVMWETTEDESDEYGFGILLTVGYLPGVKANLVPLSARDQELRGLFSDEFVMDIREYTSSVSGSASPSGIILFGDLKVDMKPVLQKLDFAFPSGTIIVGERGGRYSYRSNWQRRTRKREYIVPAVALVFAKDRNKPPGIGDTQFHVAMSTGVRPVGPKYKAASVKEKRNELSTWLSARREGDNENLDGETLLDNVYNQTGGLTGTTAIYIGVRKRRKCSIGSEKVRWQTFLEFHQVFGGDEEYLYINEVGIKTGDPFQFYISDSGIAMSSCNNISEKFRCLKEDMEKKVDQQSKLQETVFGGFIFACGGRGEFFFGRPDVDSSPFLENFPGVTLAGTFCNGEIKRGDIEEYGQEEDEEAQGVSECCFLHIFSTVYLLFSYIPAQA